MTQAARKASARPARASAFGTIRSRTDKGPSISGTKAEIVRVIRDPVLRPRHLTKSAIKAAVQYLIKATTKVAS